MSEVDIEKKVEPEVKKAPKKKDPRAKLAKPDKMLILNSSPHLHTTKSVISRMENHATDIRLSTLEKFAKAVGKNIHVALV